MGSIAQAPNRLYKRTMGVELASYHLMRTAGFKHGKAVCPQCRARTFVLYKDQRTGKLLPDEFGKCDRKEKCGFHHYPKDFFKKNAKSLSPVLTAPLRVSGTPVPNRLPYAYVTKALANVNSNNNFIKYLINLFDIEVVEFLINKYLLGIDKFNDIIFWQIDRNGEVRAGKTIPYAIDGKRRKDTRFPLSWIHAKAKDKLGRALYPAYQLEQCLFGEHLLNPYKDKPVLVFEGEKTAIIASVYAPFYFNDAICLAAGGENALTPEKLAVLAGRQVCLAPDAGVESWAKKFPTLPIWNFIEGAEKGSDFVDYLPIDKHGKALTLPLESEKNAPCAHRPIYLDFKHLDDFKNFKNKKAPYVSRREGLKIC